MTTKNFETLDGNEPVARVAYQLNEVVALFPITAASPMGEWADAWAAAGAKNLWGTVPTRRRSSVLNTFGSLDLLARHAEFMEMLTEYGSKLAFE